jgi:hypothetical protein
MLTSPSFFSKKLKIRKIIVLILRIKESQYTPLFRSFFITSHPNLKKEVMGKGRSYMNSYADGYMRGKVVKEVGALLEHMIVEEITTPTIINLEFGSAYDTIRKLRQQETSISFEIIRQFCYVLGYYLYQEIQAVENYKKYVRERESRLAMLYEMKEKYKKIYGMQAAVVLNLMHQGKDLLAFMK